MRLTFACESCGHELHVGDRHTGKKAKCRHCGHIFTVPAAGEIDAQSPVATTPPENAAEPELIVTAATSEKDEERAIAALRDLADSVKNIEAELVRFRKMIFRLVFWPLLLSILLGAWMWWSAVSQQRQLEKLLEKGGGGDMNKLLKDLGL